MSEFQRILLAVVIALPLLLMQSLWIFKDARKRGEPHYWLWGLLGIVNVPEALIIYLIATRTRGKKCPHCGKNIRKDTVNCPYCRERVGKVCSNCNSIIEEEWDYCPKCSKKIKGE